MGLLRWYLRVSLVIRIFAGFFVGSALGVALWIAGAESGRDLAGAVAPWVAPFGTVFVQMLKMIVVPVVLVTLLGGAAALPVRRFGRIGLKVIAWYFLTSLLAAVVGVGLALALNPGGRIELAGWERLTGSVDREAAVLAERAGGGGFADLLLNLFDNPFAALAQGNFLPIIVFAILFGLAARLVLDDAGEGGQADAVAALLSLVGAVRDVLFRVVDWILEYAPIGVFALSIVNFGLYGPSIVGPYVRVVLGVVGGILLMVAVAYPALILLATRRHPLPLLRQMREAVLTAFITRSSAATLPVSLRVAERELGVREELAAFSLPLGATINMDGVCIHLPFFAILAANLFGIQLGPFELVTLVVTTVLAAVGAGGVPGGSLMLLFLILDNLGLGADQVAVVVALALGVNPILDMFETANNVTGDLVCTYVVAHNEGMLGAAEAAPAPRAAA